MKRIMTLLAAVAIIAICGISASAKSPKATETAVFTVNPQMTCQNCENKIKSNLRFEKGVNSIATDLSAQTVTVTYDPAKTTPEKLTAAFKKIGYEASVATGEACAAPAQKGCCKKAEGTHCGGCKKHESGEAKQGCCKKEKVEGSHCGGCKKHESGEAKQGCCKKEKVEGSHCGGCKK